MNSKRPDNDDEIFDENYFMEEENSSLTKEDIIQKSSTIFLNFSKCDKNEKTFYISSSNIKKIIKTVNLIDDKTLKNSDIDLLIKKINPISNKFSEKNFLDLIVMIAGRIYPKDFKKNPKITINNMFLTFFEPFSRHIEDNDVNFNDIFKIPYIHKSLEILIKKFKIDYKIVSLVNNILFSLKEIYKNYFQMESQSIKNFDKIYNHSQENLLIFCKDFQITPFMLSQEQLIIYFSLITKINIENLTNCIKNDEENGNKKENYLIEPKNEIGTVYTLSRFCTSLIHFSIFSFYKNNQINLIDIDDSEKFLLFLEKLENSKGFKNFEKKSNKPHTINFTLIPKKSVLKMIQSDLLNAYDYLSDDCDNINVVNQSKVIENSRSKNNSNQILSIEKFLKEYDEKIKLNSNFELKNMFNFSEELFESLFNSNIELLKNIFSYYSKLQEKLNSSKLVYSSFLKFCKDIGVVQLEKESENSKIKKEDDKQKNILIPSKYSNLIQKKTDKLIKLKESEINLLFSSLTDDKSIRNMDFLIFLKSLEFIANKSYPKINLSEAILILFEEHLLKPPFVNKFSCSQKNVNSKIEEVKFGVLNEILNDLNPFMIFHFQNYANKNGYMNFENLFEFYKDFGIFPDIVPLCEIKNIFETLSEMFNPDESNSTNLNKTKTNEFNESKSILIEGKINFRKTKYINYELFLQSLGLAAMFFKFNDKFTDIDKFLYLIERMNQSNGINCSQFRCGNTYNSSRDLLTFLSMMKKKFPEFYSEKMFGENIKKSVNFDEIFQ